MNNRTDLAHIVVKATESGHAAPLSALLGPIRAQDWVALDLAVRGQWSLPTAGWARAGELAPNGAALAAALCHRDGHIRQAAPGAAALLPLVAIRCADWVAPVRNQARELLRGALPQAAPEVLAAVTAVALRTAQRQHGGFAHDLLVAAAREPGAADALLACEDKAARRLGHRIAVEQERFSPTRLAEITATDGDVVVQDLCADAALAAAARAGEYGGILGPLLGARQSRVRASGVTALNRTGDTVRAAAFLTDRSGVVRACARWVQRQHGIDPVPQYRTACASADVSPGAVAGLGECGTRADAALLRPLLAHPRPGVRARAVAALRALGADDAERLLPLLDDPSGAVVREVSTTLTPSADRLPEAWLRERLTADRPDRVRKAAFRLLSAHRSMARLRCFLDLLDDPHPTLRAAARTSLARWAPADAAAGYRALADEDRARLDAQLDSAAATIGERKVTVLHWYLQASR
ncbi:HEAT repeat domain-containing protein [Streptomyces sp. NPDC001404]|uniref:HEAT repeat domain-containing protein n=1 Tax=Streptomyces sp. NPDC001404 TaxID=3364571 RepID=UPI00367E8B9E